MRPSQLPEIRELMSRDYRTDVRRLNELLNSRGDAGLQEVPPVPFTGDIDSMGRGNEYMFWMYEFEGPDDYNSIRLLKSCRYMLLAD
jgi:hypothetical protein